MFRTHVKCEGCGVDTHKWYDMDKEGSFCPICYCNWFPELADNEDYEIAEEFERREELQNEN